MTKLGIWLILLLWFPSKPVWSDSIEAFEILQVVPDVSVDGKVIAYDTSTVQVFYYNSLVLYKLSYIHSYSEDDVQIIENQLRTHYILYKPGERYGLDFDEYKHPYKREILLDSAFRGEWSVQTRLYPMFVKNLSKLTASRRQGDSLVEQYTLRDLKDSMDVASAELKFTNSIGNIELSICKELDSLKNMKLYELSFVGAKDYFKSKGLTEGTYYSLYHLKKLDHFDTRFIKALFSLYDSTKTH